MAYIDNPIFGMLLTILVYTFFTFVHRRTRSAILNPIGLAMIFIIILLKYYKIDYSTYMKGGSIIGFFMAPATVAMAVPLYKQVEELKKNALPIVTSTLVGATVSVLTVVLLGLAFKLDDLSLMSLVPKSTTSAIAVDISASLGGSPSMAVAFVIITGVIGNIIGPFLMDLFWIKEPVARGLALGSSAHSVGTAKAMELGSVEGALASLAIGVVGFMTVFVAPIVLSFLGLI